MCIPEKTIERVREEKALLGGPWPERLCLWCQVRVLPEPVAVVSASMATPRMMSTCGCGALYTDAVVLLSSVRQWDLIIARKYCRVDGTSEYFTVTITDVEAFHNV